MNCFHYLWKRSWIKSVLYLFTRDAFCDWSISICGWFLLVYLRGYYLQIITPATANENGGFPIITCKSTLTIHRYCSPFSLISVYSLTDLYDCYARISIKHSDRKGIRKSSGNIVQYWGLVKTSSYTIANAAIWLATLLATYSSILIVSGCPSAA